MLQSCALTGTLDTPHLIGLTGADALPPLIGITGMKAQPSLLVMTDTEAVTLYFTVLHWERWPLKSCILN